jgi:hypothetical protein
LPLRAVRGFKLSVVASTPPPSASNHGDRLREVLTTGLLMAEALALLVWAP